MLQRRAYAYSGDGFVTAIDDLLAGSRRFGLDQTGRVTAVNGPGWGESYAYDPAGNVSAATWPAPLPGGPGAMPGPAGARPGHDAQGPREVTGTLITRAGNVRYRHDRQGRVIQRQVVRISRKPDTWHYHWDADSRLAAVTTPDHTTWRYRYDPFGRRIAKQRLTPDGDIAEQTDFTWDGTVLAEQATTTAQPGQHQVITWDYRPGSFTPLTQAEHTSPGELSEAPQEQIDQRFYSIIADLIGTPAELTAPDGTLAGCQRHTLWGTTVWDPGGAQTPLRFPGQYADPETGLHYNQHRYYDPAAGSYLTPDPLGLTPAPNPHAYVSNPQVVSDPLGLAPYDPAAEPGGGLSWAQESGILRSAAAGKGNFGLGSATAGETEALGRAWVGDGYRVASDGKTLISADGMRQFRPPSYKPNLGIYQANFEQRVPGQVGRQWFSNGHLNMTDLP